MSAGYGIYNDNDGSSHDENVDSTDYTTKIFNFTMWRLRAKE